LKLSNLATTSAQQSYSAGNRFNRTNGVAPINAVMSDAIVIASR